MDAVSPPNIPDDPELLAPAGPTMVQEPRRLPGCRTPPHHGSFHAYDSISILMAGSAMYTDGVHADRPTTDGDSVQTAGRAYDTDSTQTAHLTCDTDSNRTFDTACDTDSTRALHSAYDPERPARAGETGAGGVHDPGTTHTEELSEEPPPYSPPDPKLAYLIYPPPLPHYANQPVIACQPAAVTPAFYQPPFVPTSTYPSYAIYMNGPPIAEEPPTLPKDYLVESLLVTVFCCLLSGLVALMYSFETRAALARGDIREGERASQKARLLVMFSLMFGVVVFVGWIVYVIIALGI